VSRVGKDAKFEAALCWHQTAKTYRLSFAAGAVHAKMPEQRGSETITRLAEALVTARLRVRTLTHYS